MQFSRGVQLAYCTNIHRAETWPETLANLERYSLAVRDRVSPGRPFAIGLRLGADAARDLSEPATLLQFQRWLDRHGCYVFTINGFPYGRFHGTRVKEQVYTPDWTSPERLAYTNLLFALLAKLVPPGGEGSVSTVPGSFKAFLQGADAVRAMRANLWRCVESIATLSERSGRDLHLGLEPEPLCFLETSEEAVRFFEALRADRPGDPRLDRHLGVNYDACHLAIEFEEAPAALGRLRAAGVRLSKVHLSSALKVRTTPEALARLRDFADGVYFHQVVARDAAGGLRRHPDLDVALAAVANPAQPPDEEWRIHFHVPLHCQPEAPLATTADHLEALLDGLRDEPGLCRHFEMETYTWDVLPPALKARDVVEQLAAEYAWTLARFAERGLRPVGAA